MKLTSRRVTAFVALIGLALAGLVLVQWLLLQSARELKEQTFRQNVLQALGKAASRLETAETADRVVRLSAHGKSGPVTLMGFQWSMSDNVRINIPADSLHPGGIKPWGYLPSTPLGESFTTAITNEVFGRDSLRVQSIKVDSVMPVRVRDSVITYTVSSPQHVRIQVLDPVRSREQTLVNETKAAGEYEVVFAPDIIDTNNFVVRYASDSLSLTLQVDSRSHSEEAVPRPLSDTARLFLVQRVIDNLVTAEAMPIEARIDNRLLDSLLRTELAQQGIDLEYAFGILNTHTDSLRLAKPDELRREIRESDLRTRLFPNDMFASRSDLVLYFPERSSYMWRQVGPMVASSGIFMLIIIGCFAYSIRTIVRQQRFATLTIDFINNMTHEFKTPISTVALAAEALEKNEVVADTERHTRFTKMIREENTRMRSQVEKILQMAQLEEGDYELTMTDVDLHGVLGNVLSAVTLQVEHRGGELITDLKATAPVITADPVHVSNIVHNLVDNAIKYSEGPPQITVSTRNESRGLWLSVADKGIGIAERDQKLVFEKYFRVPSGNVHNVKGFGLGLSYVRLMTAAMGGKVQLESDLGKGTTVSVWLPLAEPSVPEVSA